MHNSRIYQPLKAKVLRSSETYGHVKLPTTQRKIPEDKNPVIMYFV